jgi:hypothetical protein
VVRILGDGSSFSAMCKDLPGHAAQAAKAVEDQTKKIEGFADAIKRYAGDAVSALGSLGASSFLKQSFADFEGRETNMIRLSAALRANNRDVVAVTAEYERFAHSLESVSTASREQILSSLRGAEAHGLTGAAAERATRAALNLSYAQHGSADGMEHMLRLTAAVEEGNIHMAMRFARMIPELRGVRDESEFVAKYQRLMASGMIAASEVANSSAGVIQRLANSYKEFKADLGEIIAEGVGPYVKILTDLVGWFRALSKETKTAIVVAGGLVVVLLAIPPALALISVIWHSMTGGVFLLFGALVAGGAAIIYWISSLGGVGKAWEWVKQKAMDFWEWARPMWRAFSGVAVAAWEIIKVVAIYCWTIIKYAAIAFYGWLKGIWTSMFGDARISWDDIKNFVIEVFIAIEFGLRNIKKVAAVVWLGMKYDFLAFAAVVESWIGGENYFARAAEMARVAWMNAAGVLGNSYAQFRAQRLLEINASPEAIRAAESAGGNVGAAFNAGVAKELKKLDAVLTGSAEALFRLAAYRERNAGIVLTGITSARLPEGGSGGGGGGGSGGGGGGGGSGGGGGAPVVGPGAAPDSSATQIQIRDLLKEIRDFIRDRLPINPLTTDSVIFVQGL